MIFLFYFQFSLYLIISCIHKRNIKESFMSTCSKSKALRKTQQLIFDK